MSLFTSATYNLLQYVFYDLGSSGQGYFNSHWLDNSFHLFDLLFSCSIACWIPAPLMPGNLSTSCRPFFSFAQIALAYLQASAFLQFFRHLFGFFFVDSTSSTKESTSPIPKIRWGPDGMVLRHQAFRPYPRTLTSNRTYRKCRTTTRITIVRITPVSAKASLNALAVYPDLSWHQPRTEFQSA